MRKVILYIASSLNGKIARSDGSVDWLHEVPNPDQLDYGYKTMYDAIDTTIQGYKTYAQVIGWDIPFPYSGKNNYVLTRRKNLKDSDEVTFVTKDHIAFIQKLKEAEGKDIWLIGGAQINSMLLEAGLIDEIQLFIMPVIIDGGIEVFNTGSISKDFAMNLTHSKSYPTGVVELHYRKE